MQQLDLIPMEPKKEPRLLRNLLGDMMVFNEKTQKWDHWYGKIPKKTVKEENDD